MNRIFGPFTYNAMSKQRRRVAVLYGGRSGEHEISLMSAASVIRNLDPDRWEVVPIGIDKQGRWRYNDVELLEGMSMPELPLDDNRPSLMLPPHPSGGRGELTAPGSEGIPPTIDVVFPVVHGPLCEDGTLQGLLELADVPYVGSGVLGSAIGMDKDVAKRLAVAAGIEVAPFLVARRDRYRRDHDAAAGLVARIESVLGYPCFVKPANMGSSVGIHKAHDRGELMVAIEDAFLYDLKILIEAAIDAREIELAVMENPDAGAHPLVSVPGEILPTHEFYSYEAKYLDEHGAALEIPARLTVAQVSEAQHMAGLVFETLECEGMARVDLFLERNTGRLLFNEVNTLPGFTTISMYPKLWAATGVPYSDLLSKLLDLAIARHARRSSLLREKGDVSERIGDPDTGTAVGGNGE